MYYYAVIELETGICYDVMEVDYQITDDPSCIELDSNDKSYMFRKKYVDGVWVDTTPAEAQQFEGAHIGIHGEWLDIVINGKAPLDHTHEGYATSNHTHTEYASSDDLALLEDVVSTKADAAHTHPEYASSTHTHNNYATITALDTLESELDSKAGANHTHTEYAPSTHTHDEYAETNHAHSNYAETTHTHDDYASVSHSHTASEIGAAVSGHNHDNDYADINHNHDSAYATIGHDHDEDYATVNHAHTDYATTVALSELSATVSGKANASHSHNDIYYTENEIDTKLADKSDISHTHTGVYDVNGAAASALSSANAYTDTEIDALSETMATKANTSDLTSHTGNSTVHITSTERNNWNAAKTHADSAHAPSNAEENQNAFSNVVVGSETISADKKTDTLTLVAGNNVTITPDATGDSITISSTNTVYTHPTSSGNKHIPAGGSSGQILRWSADGIAVWGNDNNTTYSNATQTSSGLMSNTDKTKLDGIAEGANKYILPSAGTALGGVKTGGDVTISSGVITVNDDSHNHIISNVDGLQSALDSKAASGHDHNSVYYTETEVDTLLSGKANSSHTHTIANITNLQSTLDGKANTSHGTHVSYSTTAPVMDGSASVGTASTVARSDHKHPTDTSRAAQTSLDAHTSNKSNPHGVTLAQLGLTATAAELNALDGITATVTELNFVDGVTSNIQTQLNSKAASSHSHSISNITNLQTTLDGKAASSHTHTVANISDLTATAKELNYMDGVTSNVQTQLDGKAASSHNHSASNITSGTLSSDRLPTVPIAKGGTGATTAAGALTNLGITATASELNKLDGVTATTAELNYVDGVTSNIQTQLNGKAASSHGTHVTYGTAAPKANGTAAVGTASTVSRSDHVHPSQTTVSGNAGTATTISKRVKITSSQSANAGKYIKFGTITLSSGYSGFMGYLMFNPTETSAGANGLLHLHIRNGADTTTTSCTMKWLTINESKYAQTVSAVKVSNGVFDLYYKPIGTWDTMEIIVVSGDNHGTLSLANSGTYVDSITATYTSSIGGQVNYANSAGSAASATTASTCTGNSATATKLSSARTISLTGDVTGSTSFDGSGNVSITATVADDSHNHTIANVDGLQTALNGKSATSHNHDSAYISKDLQMTSDTGDISISWSGKDVVAQFKALASGMYTAYSPVGNTNNPNSGESFRFMCHKTGSANYGWIMAYGGKGSVYTGYIDNGNWQGWKAIWEYAPAPLWSGGANGGYYMTAGHTVTPTKKLSECRNGWALLWSDYDVGGQANNTDFYMSYIYKRAYTGQVWGGGQWYCDIPSYSAGTATDSEQRVIKLLQIYDAKIVGTENNAAAPRNDVVLRAVYEF